MSLPCVSAAGSCPRQRAESSLPAPAPPCTTSCCPGSSGACTHPVTPASPRRYCLLLCSCLTHMMPQWGERGPFSLAPSLSPYAVASWFLTPTGMTVSSLSHQLPAGRDGLSHCHPWCPASPCITCVQTRAPTRYRCRSACHPMPVIGFLSLPL